jgi:hypothetical protein
MFIKSIDIMNYNIIYDQKKKKVDKDFIDKKNFEIFSQLYFRKYKIFNELKKKNLHEEYLLYLYKTIKYNKTITYINFLESRVTFESWAILNYMKQIIKKYNSCLVISRNNFIYETSKSFFNYHDINIKQKFIDITKKDYPSNKSIKEEIKNITMYDIIFLDIIYNFYNYEGTEILPLFLSYLIISLEKLNIGGTLFLYYPIITNDLNYSIFLFLCKYFDKVEYKTNTNSKDKFIILINYKEKPQLDKFYEINEKNYEYYPSGLLDIDYKPRLSKIFDFNDNTNNKEEIKKINDEKLNDMIDSFNNSYNIFTIFNDNTKFIEEYDKRMYYESVNFANKHNIPLFDWVLKDKKKFFDDNLNNVLGLIPHTFYDKITHKYKVEIKTSPNIQIDLQDKMNELFFFSENCYKYMMGSEIGFYSKIELFINYHQKELNKQIKEKKNITINDRYVSRAWMKMLELLIDTKFLDNIKPKEILGFHACEAPGNFINCIIYYTNKINKKYIWNANTLKESKIYDDFGFIAKTQDKWDYGKDKTGNIMNYENLKYYYDKYKNSDIYVSDCGGSVMITDEEGNRIHDVYRNLGVWQIIYALLIPRVGGNCVIKTNSANVKPLMLSLIYLLNNYYEEFYLFKSNINFWSTEIYYVGKNKKELSSNDINELLKLAENLDKRNMSYPCEKISSEFLLILYYILNKHIASYVNVKKFFVFLTENKDIYEENKDNIIKLIKSNNKKWFDKYMK